MQQISGKKQRNQRKQRASGSTATDAPTAAGAASAQTTAAAAAAASVPPQAAGSKVPITYPSPHAATTPVGMPMPVAKAGHAPITMPPPDQLFSTAGIAYALADPGQNERLGPYQPQVAPGKVPGEGHIPMMPADVAAAASVSMGAILAETDPSAAPEGATSGPTGSDGLSRLKHVLDTLGFAIVTDVLSPAECAAVEQTWADDLRSLIDTDKSPNKALLEKLMADPVHQWPMDKLPLGSKFASDYGLPQGRAAWQCRTHPKVQQLFSAIFGGTDVCTGMDNVFFTNTPSATGANASATSRLWPHADQNLHVAPSGKWECYQGVLYVWPADANTSATVVWPRSHQLVYPGLLNSGRRYRRHFCMLDKAQTPDFARNAGRVPVPSGAMLLWNSRTIHQGWPGGARLAFPICCEPKSRRDHKALASKQQVLMQGFPTTHWASLGEAHCVASGDVAGFEADGISIRHAAHRHAQTADGHRLRPEFMPYL